MSIVQYRMGILFPPVLNTPAVPGPFSLAFVCTSWSVCVTLAHTDLFLTNFLSALDMSNSCFRIVPQRPAVESTKEWKHTGSRPAISLQNDPKHLSPALCFSSGGGGKWLRVSHVSSSLPLWQGWRTACSRDYGLILRLSWGYGLGLCVLD